MSRTAPALDVARPTYQRLAVAILVTILLPLSVLFGIGVFFALL